MEQYVICERPTDFPTKFVVRRWIIGPGTAQAGPVIAVVDTLEEARDAVPQGLYCLPRYPDDDPVIVEVWT